MSERSDYFALRDVALNNILATVDDEEVPGRQPIAEDRTTAAMEDCEKKECIQEKEEPDYVVDFRGLKKFIQEADRNITLLNSSARKNRDRQDKDISDLQAVIILLNEKINLLFEENTKLLGIINNSGKRISNDCRRIKLKENIPSVSN